MQDARRDAWRPSRRQRAPRAHTQSTSMPSAPSMSSPAAHAKPLPTTITLIVTAVQRTPCGSSHAEHRYRLRLRGLPLTAAHAMPLPSPLMLRAPSAIIHPRALSSAPGRCHRCAHVERPSWCKRASAARAHRPPRCT